MFEVIPKNKTTNVTLRFPDELLQSIKAMANAANTSISNVVLQACQYAIKSTEEKKEVVENEINLSPESTYCS